MKSVVFVFFTSSQLQMIFGRAFSSLLFLCLSAVLCRTASFEKLLNRNLILPNGFTGDMEFTVAQTYRCSRMNGDCTSTQTIDISVAAECIDQGELEVSVFQAVVFVPTGFSFFFYLSTDTQANVLEAGSDIGTGVWKTCVNSAWRIPFGSRNLIVSIVSKKGSGGTGAGLQAEGKNPDLQLSSAVGCLSRTKSQSHLPTRTTVSLTLAKLLKTTATNTKIDPLLPPVSLTKLPTQTQLSFQTRSLSFSVIAPPTKTISAILSVSSTISSDTTFTTGITLSNGVSSTFSLGVSETSTLFTPSEVVTASVTTTVTGSRSLIAFPSVVIAPQTVLCNDIRTKGVALYFYFSGAFIDTARATIGNRSLVDFIFSSLSVNATSLKPVNGTPLFALQWRSLASQENVKYNSTLVFGIKLNRFQTFRCSSDSVELITVAFHPQLFVDYVAPSAAEFNFTTPPDPPKPLISQTIANAAEGVTASMGAAGSLAAASGPAAAQAARNKALMEAEFCMFTYSDDGLSFFAHPLQFSIGSDRTKFYAGAMVGNIIVVCGFGLIHLAVSQLLGVFLKTNFLSAASRARFPGNSFVVVMLLMQEAVTACIVVAIHSRDYKARLVAGLLLTFWFLVPVIVLRITAIRRQFPAQHVSSNSLKCLPVYLRDDDVVEKKRSCFRIFMFGTCEWVDRAGNEGFVKRFGFLFGSYRARRQWFLVVELAMIIATAGITGVRPSSCEFVNLSYLILFSVFFFSILILAPYSTWYDQAAMSLIAFLGVASAVFLIARVQAGLATNIAFAAMIASSVKAFTDVILTLYDFFSNSDGCKTAEEEGQSAASVVACASSRTNEPIEDDDELETFLLNVLKNPTDVGIGRNENVNDSKISSVTPTEVFFPVATHNSAAHFADHHGLAPLRQWRCQQRQHVEWTDDETFDPPVKLKRLAHSPRLPAPHGHRRHRSHSRHYDRSFDKQRAFSSSSHRKLLSAANPLEAFKAQHKGSISEGMIDDL